MSLPASTARIYFMSGTGNSYWSAREAGRLASESGVNPDLISTDSIKEATGTRPGREDIVIFSYPTHGFIVPWHMLKFILLFPSGRSRVILINNRAGMKMGKLFTPGLSGLAVLLPMLILVLKGYRIVSALPMDTPSNWISVHPGLKQKVIESIFNKRKQEIETMWLRVKERGKYFPAKFYIMLPLDILISPLSFGYLLFGRFILGRTYFTDPSCDGCGICADRCPVSAIKMVEGKPWWTYRCESCMRCSNICPKGAVNSSVPLTVLYVIVLSKIVNGKYGVMLSDMVAESGLPAGELFYYLALWLVTVLLTWGLYSLLFWLARIKPVSHLIAMTTPMRYWRKYIAPGFRGLYKPGRD